MSHRVHGHLCRQSARTCCGPMGRGLRKDVLPSHGAVYCPHRYPLNSACRNASWMVTAATDALTDAIVRRRPFQPGGIDDPTVDVLDPGGSRTLSFHFDRSRRPRLSHMRAWTTAAGSVDPFELVSEDMSGLAEGIRSLLGSDHPVLHACAQYLFNVEGGKKIRPAMVLLMSKAASAGDEHCVSGHVLDGQKRLAEITEMIHTASLFHDDVIDEAETRRGATSLHKLYGNKMAILAGDFLLARASVLLARLRDVEVVELLSTVIEHLVKGEVMQSRPGTSRIELNGSAIEYYLRKNYYKTGSLMANSCRAAVMLAGHGEATQEHAFAYGRHVGLAFQSSDTLGKPALSDLRQGIATAPVLFAAECFPEMMPMLKRKCQGTGDVEEVLRLVGRSHGIEKTKDVAMVQAEQAMEAALGLIPSPARDGLINLAARVVQRTK